MIRRRRRRGIRPRMDLDLRARRAEVAVDTTELRRGAIVPSPVARSWNPETRVHHDDDELAAGTQRRAAALPDGRERSDVLDREQTDGGIEARGRNDVREPAGVADAELDRQAFALAPP